MGPFSSMLTRKERHDLDNEQNVQGTNVGIRPAATSLHTGRNRNQHLSAHPAPATHGALSAVHPQRRQSVPIAKP